MQYLGLAFYTTLFTVSILSNIKKINKSIICIFIFLYLLTNFITIGLRPLNAGSDTESYLHNYYLIRNNYDLPLSEIGFQLLLHTCSFFDISENYLWPTLTIIFLSLTYFSTQSFNLNQKILIILGLASSTTFFDLETNGIRQGLATLIGIIAIFNFNGIKQTILIIAALLFHYSAAILAIILFANKITSFRKKTVLKFLATALGLLLIGFIFGKNFISIENFTILPKDFIVVDKFSSYTESGLKGTYESLSLIGRLTQSIPIIVLIGISIALPSQPEFRAVYFTAIILSFFYILLSSTGYSYRWSYYPYLITIYLIPWFFSKTSLSQKKIKVMHAIVCVAYLLWGTYSVWMNGIFLWNN